MKSGVSEIVGQAVFQDGTTGTVYRALRPLLCASCSSVVAEGEMFTRDAQSERGLRLWPRCRACLPFALGLDRLDKRTRSSLLQTLLTPVEQDKAADETRSVEAFAATDEQQKATDEPQETKDKRRKATEAMRQRLGPALARTRRSRTDKS
ncbi:MAG: hypothetical protein ICV68_08160 [Pyrinomonadaceae bacterium]|nr:hypothetical protein [Pyrinomonadaceae bacterium]